MATTSDQASNAASAMTPPGTPANGHRKSADEFLKLIRQQQLGKLKIYIGACPGVGKTYQMLLEGNRLKAQGVDVVIGYVEPHDRKETADQIKDLEVIPPKLIPYSGTTLREMDLQAVLERRPTLVLVDEMAHTNASGVKNKKRYEDIDDLRHAGINIISTVNIQHLESLYNIVEDFTGVKVRERVPDAFIANADQIVNVDLPAEDLLERLRTGKIYPQRNIETALTHFFTEKNLTRLREITLSETASYLDRRQREQLPGQSNVGPISQVMIALSSRGANPGALLRKGARLAENLNAAWYVVYVRTEAESPTNIALEVQRRLHNSLDIAQKMGGIVIMLKNQTIADGLVNFAKEYGITHLVVGKSKPRKGWAFFKPHLLHQLLQRLPQVDFFVV